MPYIAGPYTATYSASSIGGTRSGFMHNERPLHQPVIDDAHGDAPADGIQQGATVDVTLDFIEYALIEAALYAASVKGAPKTNVGKILTTFSGALVLSAVASTSPATRTYYKAVVVSDIQALLASKLRQGPCTFRCYPDSGHTNKAYADT